MAARKLTLVKKPSGRNVAEHERNTERLTLRMLPVHMRQLERLAERWGCGYAEVVATLVVNELGRDTPDRSADQ
jgi:hypothetical protein